VRLARLGSTRLDLAEARVEELLSASGSVATRPTDARAPEPTRGSEAIKTRPLETLDARPEPKQREPR
jgi:hypothetical protein